ncbi:hypothetical protein CEXT_772481 [Caerostris extrusa]|uniref:Uncharacterized protein n=1 Tax=Caerostris extrusa TaxID=172846 RepID=A0AAV4P3A3_CAEEX|nr:hypothetical protein CEXT_772481 [Caerostris extrusa]
MALFLSGLRMRLNIQFVFKGGKACAEEQSFLPHVSSEVESCRKAECISSFPAQLIRESSSVTSQLRSVFGSACGRGGASSPFGNRCRFEIVEQNGVGQSHCSLSDDRGRDVLQNSDIWVA